MENEMKFSKAIRYDDYEDYFRLNGNCNMKLSGKAAKDFCKHAADRGILVWRVEGGIMREQGKKFEVRLDCIWDSPDYIMEKPEAIECNMDSLKFIERMESELGYDFFMLLVRKYDESRKYNRSMK